MTASMPTAFHDLQRVYYTTAAQYLQAYPRGVSALMRGRASVAGREALYAIVFV